MHVLHPSFTTHMVYLMYFCTNVTVHDTWQYVVPEGSVALVEDDQWLRPRDFAVLTFAE